MSYTRRQFGTLTAAGLAGSALLHRQDLLAHAFADTPNSVYAGVAIGMNVPIVFKAGGSYMAGDEILRRLLLIGSSVVELRAQPVELFMGSPEAVAAVAAAGPGGGGRGGGGRGRGAALTPEETAAQQAAAEAQRKWRLSASMDKVREFRKKFNDAGVSIPVVKWDGIFGFTEDEADYAFEVAKTLGANAVSCEMPAEALIEADTARVGKFAAKHKMMVGYHNHSTVTAATFEKAFTFSPANGANFDIGHFFGATKTSPVPFLKQHHDRITHIHVKDKTLQDVNKVFGQGETPVKEVLQLIRDNRWKIPAVIELEYPIPEGSDAMAELVKCQEYCKQCLLS